MRLKGAALVAVCAVGGLAGMYFLNWLGFLQDASPETGGDAVTTDASDGWKTKVQPNDGVIAHRERADGVDPRLQGFLDAVAARCSFRVCVCPQGGVRSDEDAQAELYASGASNAATLDATPHGHAAAVDVAPYARNALGLLEPLYSYSGPFAELGAIAKSMGLAWGGDWGWKDLAHVEVPDWQNLPFPPGGVA